MEERFNALTVFEARHSVVIEGGQVLITGRLNRHTWGRVVLDGQDLYVGAQAVASYFNLGVEKVLAIAEEQVKVDGETFVDLASTPHPLVSVFGRPELTT